MSGQALAIYDVAPVIHSHRVKYVLCDIDPEDVYLLLHGTRLLWLHGCTALELIVAHCSRSAQGRVHFITTNCWDNAVAESFFHTLKTELVYMEDFNTHEQAQTAVFEYIEVFYNRQRCHSANGYLAPLVYEQTLKTNEIFCPEKC